MALDYSKLWNECAKAGLNKTELRKKCGISTATLAKFSKNEPVSLEVIEKICLVLNCNPGDVFTVVRTSDNVLLNVLYKEMSTEDKDGLFFETAVRLTNSCISVKGILLTKDQTCNFLKTGLIAGDNISIKYSDLEFTLKIFDCIKYLCAKAEEKLSVEIINEVSRRLDLGEFAGIIDMKLMVERYENSQADSNARIAALYNAIVSLNPLNNVTDIVARLITFKEALRLGILPAIIEPGKMLPLSISLRRYQSDPSQLMNLLEEERLLYKSVIDYYCINI